MIRMFNNKGVILKNKKSLTLFVTFTTYATIHRVSKKTAMIIKGEIKDTHDTLICFIRNLCKRLI